MASVMHYDDLPARPCFSASEEKRSQVETVLNGFRAVGGPLAYVSMPVTGGPRLYDTLEAHHVRSVEELRHADPDAFLRDVLQQNVAAGKRLVRRIGSFTPLTAVTPAIFEARALKWDEPEYMCMWIGLLEEKVREVYMSPGWEYSNGCSQELTHGVHRQFFDRKTLQTHVRRTFAGDGGSISAHKLRYIESCKKSLPVTIFTHRGNVLQIDKAAGLLADAVEDLSERGFPYASLWASFETLHEIGAYFHRHPSRGCPPYHFDWEAMDRGFERLRDLRP